MRHARRPFPARACRAPPTAPWRLRNHRPSASRHPRVEGRPSSWRHRDCGPGPAARTRMLRRRASASCFGVVFRRTTPIPNRHHPVPHERPAQSRPSSAGCPWSGMRMRPSLPPASNRRGGTENRDADRTPARGSGPPAITRPGLHTAVALHCRIIDRGFEAQHRHFTAWHTHGPDRERNSPAAG